MKHLKLFLATLSLITTLSTFAQISGPGTSMNGTKKAPKQNGMSGHRRPSKKAVEACKGKSQGASCSFESRKNKEVSGVCFAPESSLPLACIKTDEN